MSQLLANFINLIALSFALCDADNTDRSTHVTRHSYEHRMLEVNLVFLLLHL